MHKSIFLLFLGASIISFHFLIQNVSFPNTYINSISVGLSSKQKIREILDQQKKRSVELIVKDRYYSIPLNRLGLTVNTTETLRRIFTRNTQPFPHNYLAFFNSFFTKQTYLPAIEFSSDFYHLTQQMVFDFTTKEDEIYFDDEKKVLALTSNQEKYRIDIPLFQISIIKIFGDKKLFIQPQLIKINNNQQSDQHISSLNSKLAMLYKNPVTLSVQDLNDKHDLTITSNDLKNILGVNYNPTTKDIEITVQEKNLQQIIHAKNIYLKNTDKTINITQIKNSLEKIFHDRLLGIPSNTILVSTTLKPNTDGTIATKYIEIDLSSQRMYLWEKGNIIADYVVSTGLYYPTPTGKFQILNKAKNAFSDIYNVWMPYWMAIYYDPKIKAYIGIHELPYWYSGGRIQRRPREFLGTPRTGGCISLDVGIAQKVQDWADIGMPVYIFN